MNAQDKSFYSDDQDDFDSRHLREAKSTSTGTKILFIVLGVFGVLLLACCGGVFWFWNKVEAPRATSDPTEIREIAESILDIDLPERFEPQQAVTMDMVFMKMEVVSYEAGDGSSMLELTRVEMPVQEAQREDARRSMQSQSGGQTQLENFKSESKTYTVDGREISVVYSHGTRSSADGVPADQAGAEWFSVQTTLATKRDLIIITVNGPEEEFDQEEIESMIQSIRLPE